MLRLLTTSTLLLTTLVSAAYGEGNRRRDNVSELISLGDARINSGENRASIDVPQQQSFFDNKSFRTLQFFADDNEVYLERINVHYFLGNPTPITVGRLIPRDGQIQVDLGFPQSYMRRIDMAYRSWTGPQWARIRVFGELSNAEVPRPPREVRIDPALGCRNVDLYGADRDRISIYPGRRLTGIQLQVSNAGIKMEDLLVLHADGLGHEIRVRNTIQPGPPMERLPLPYPDREVVQITMVYERLPAVFQSGRPILLPRVCVHGFEFVRDVPRR